MWIYLRECWLLIGGCPGTSCVLYYLNKYVTFIVIWMNKYVTFIVIWRNMLQIVLTIKNWPVLSRWCRSIRHHGICLGLPACSCIWQSSDGNLLIILSQQRGALCCGHHDHDNNLASHLKPIISASRWRTTRAFWSFPSSPRSPLPSPLWRRALLMQNLKAEAILAKGCLAMSRAGSGEAACSSHWSRPARSQTCKDQGSVKRIKDQ